VTLTVRAERPGDADAIRAVNAAAFGRGDEGAIVDAIRGTDRWIRGGSLVAQDAARTVVGHLLLSEGDLEASGGARRRVWLVGPVAVMPARQRAGIGGALMRAAIELAIAHSQPVICLLGHAAYYARFGFEPARAIGIDPPRPWPDDSWLALRLPAWDPSIRGAVRYPDPFPDAQ
jgi:predicted N-acetyltransferase YhbS